MDLHTLYAENGVFLIHSAKNVIKITDRLYGISYSVA